MKVSQEVVPQVLASSRNELENRYQGKEGALVLKKIIASLEVKK